MRSSSIKHVLDDPSLPEHRAGLLPLLWILVTAGCGISDESGPDAFTERDSARVMIAASGAPAWAEGEGWELSDAPVAVIGRSAADPEDQLFRVRGLARLADGRIAVLNMGTREVRYFAPDGSFLYAAGGQGEGPGEMRYPNHMTRGAADTLLINDMPFLHRYGPDGAYGRTESLDWAHVVEEAPAGLRYGALMDVLPDGSVFGWLTGEPEEAGGTWSESVLVMTYAPSEGRVSFLDWWTFASGRIVAWQGDETSVQHPLAAELAWAVGGSPERPLVVVGRSDRPSYRLYAPDGTLLRIVRWGAEPSPVTAEVAERAMTRARENRPEEIREEFDATTATLPPPEALPYYFGLAVDEEGGVWVRDFTVSSRDPASFTVFDRRGRWLGTVPVPAGLEHPMNAGGVVIGRDWFLGVWRNELDVQEVRLYRVRKPTPGTGSPS